MGWAVGADESDGGEVGGGEEGGSEGARLVAGTVDWVGAALGGPVGSSPLGGTVAAGVPGDGLVETAATPDGSVSPVGGATPPPPGVMP